MAQLLMTVHFI